MRVGASREKKERGKKTGTEVEKKPKDRMIKSEKEEGKVEKGGGRM